MSEDREFILSDRDFAFLVKVVKERTGIVMGENKRNMIYSRLARRLRELKLKRFKDYCELLESARGADEMSHFINSVTTNLTHFFRESHHFDHLKDSVLTPLFSSKADRKSLRIWSAGCSSGAEPYSIAMVLEKMRNLNTNWDCKILATDIDSNMLRTGVGGIYPQKMTEKIPAAYREFVKSTDDSEYEAMGDRLKKYITFNRLNLLEQWPMKGPFDVIFCRNVVIYFDKETQRVLFDRMANLLKPDGWLYIGHSETLSQVCDRFELQGKTIYRRVV